MQDKNNPTQANPDPAETATVAVSQAAQGDFIKKVVEKIKSSENILVVLSRTPSVDEIAAAIGLTLFLDGIQKHTTAVYSGRIPDSLVFLQPSETFEDNTDSLQDFIISLNKDKADHLRYKLEGDFVKIFITPYKSTISEDDLSFSHGDYNVDFVIAINVASSGNLDRALHEHGRIMRDASVVNITAGDPGRFGEIEWSNPSASSLCAMITNLIFAIQESDEKPLDHDIATALLAGIVAATDRFSNNRTNPDTLGIASKLMSMGADQQLITSNINGNEIINNEDDSTPYNASQNPEKTADAKTNLTIDHDDFDPTSPNPYANPTIAANLNTQPQAVPNPLVNPAAQVAPNLNMDSNPAPTAMINDTNNVDPESVVVQPVIPGTTPTTPLADPSQMQIPGATAPTPPNAPTPISTPPAPAAQNTASADANVTPSTPPVDPSQMQIPTPPSSTTTTNGHNIMTETPTPPAAKQIGNNLTPPAPTHKQPKNYAEMMEAALSENSSKAPLATPISTPTTASPSPTAASQPTPAPMEPIANPTAPILPPPPAPAADANGMMPPVLPPVQMPPQA